MLLPRLAICEPGSQQRPGALGIDHGRRRLLLGGASLALATLLHDVRAVAAAPARCGTPPSEPLPFAPPGDEPSAPGTPRRVEIAGGAYRYRLLVDGWPMQIHGMGYNPVGGEQTDGERLDRLRRDFGLMRGAGVNTVFGWDPAQFDRVTLDAAEAAGLGVAPPFDVDFRADYRDVSERKRFADGVLAWVERYRRHPAVRFWAIGNEAFQRTVPPAWCASPPTAEAAERATALAALLVDVADRVRSLDPSHPVLYRASEDAYAPWIAEALRARPMPRPWFVYGVNAYTPRLGQILAEWPTRGIDAALLVSEFALLGAERGRRADAFAELWSTVRAYPDYVLGGAVYVWYAEGPEEVDREFGLVDRDGRAVDDGLESIGRLYREYGPPAPAGALAPESPPPPTSGGPRGGVPGPGSPAIASPGDMRRRREVLA